jgi:thioredoxin 1
MNRDVLNEVTREELAASRGPLVVEFGASWCGICRAFRPVMDQVLHDFPDIVHCRIEDGKGKPLGRSFRVTLWPTFVFLRDGQVVERLVRPEAAEVRTALKSLVSNPALQG